jgi:hypothetical protein
MIDEGNEGGLRRRQVETVEEYHCWGKESRKRRTRTTDETRRKIQVTRELVLPRKRVTHEMTDREKVRTPCAPRGRYRRDPERTNTGYMTGTAQPMREDVSINSKWSNAKSGVTKESLVSKGNERGAWPIAPKETAGCRYRRREQE